MMNVRSKIKAGDLVKYKKKKWIVIYWDIVCEGNVMRLSMVKYPKNSCPRLLWTKELYDEQIEELEILKEKRP